MNVTYLIDEDNTQEISILSSLYQLTTYGYSVKGLVRNPVAITNFNSNQHLDLIEICRDSVPTLDNFLKLTCRFGDRIDTSNSIRMEVYNEKYYYIECSEIKTIYLDKDLALKECNFDYNVKVTSLIVGVSVSLVGVLVIAMILVCLFLYIKSVKAREKKYDDAIVELTNGANVVSEEIDVKRYLTDIYIDSDKYIVYIVEPFNKMIDKSVPMVHMKYNGEMFAIKLPVVNFSDFNDDIFIRTIRDQGFMNDDMVEVSRSLDKHFEFYVTVQNEKKDDRYPYFLTISKEKDKNYVIKWDNTARMQVKGRSGMFTIINNNYVLVGP